MSNSSKGNIIIVEDNKSQIKVFDKIINQIDYNSISFSNGEDLLNFLKNNNDNIKLILLDFYLENHTALDILPLINKLPVAILSIDSRAENIVDSIKAGASNFFVKGDEEELLRLYSYIESI